MLRIIPIVRAQIIPSTLKPETARWSDLIEVINNIISFVLVDLIPIVAILIFAYAGFLFVTAAGNEGRIKAAKAWLVNGAIGLAIALSAGIVINTIVKYLDLEGRQDISPFEERVEGNFNNSRIYDGAQPF